MSHLPDLFECLKIHVCKDIALRKRQDLEGHSTVMVLQGGDVVVAHCQLCAGIDLVPDGWVTQVNGLFYFTLPWGFTNKREGPRLPKAPII